MKHQLARVLLFLSVITLSGAPVLMAQQSARGAISHHGYDRDRKMDDEYRMSHLDGDAGDLIGLVLPSRIASLPIVKGSWDVSESEMVKIVEHSATSANIRLLKSGTTVVNFKYKVLREGREVSEAYPFTIRIHRIDPEAIVVPSTLYLGWDVSEYLYKHVRLQPDYSESVITYSLVDPTLADIDESYDGLRITGRRLGETTLHVETSSGLHAEARVLVQIPELRDIDIKAEEKTLKPGDTMQLNLKLSPARAQAKVTWSSEKPEIVSITQDGVVTAVAEGKSTIRVVADNGEKDSITLKVKK